MTGNTDISALTADDLWIGFLDGGRSLRLRRFAAKTP
jgi:hypothetical protein